MKNKIVDIVCLCIIGAAFGSVAILNLFQTDRPTISDTEQRELAKMPEFSVESLADGSYFSDLSVYVSDTFIYRDQLVGLSKKLDTLKGIEYMIGGDDTFVLLDNSTSYPSENEDDMNNQILNALENLKNDENSSTDELHIADDESSEIQSVNGEIVNHDEIISSDDTSSSDENDGTAETNELSDPSEPDDETVVTAITLSKKSLRLTIGSGSVIYASLETSDNESAKVKWSISDKNVATISMNPSGGIDVKGVALGTATLTCSWKDRVKATCEITVEELNVGGNNSLAENADFLTNGMFIYGDAVYTQGFYSESAAISYARTALYYKQLFGENTRVSTVVIPVSSMVVDNPDVQSKIPDQLSILEKMASWMDPSVNFVNVYSEMYDHRNEYLYFKSDHHWTQRGAYYAYRAFAESVGLEPTPLDDFDYSILNDSYNGSLYQYTQDERVKAFTDVIESFSSRKQCTITVTTSSGSTLTGTSCVSPYNKTYAGFIYGDNPYTVINVPENPQDKNILVFKDSFGNAFVPFLCEHYGNIFVVDVRYSSFNIYDNLKDNGITDIVFVNNIQAANSTTWSKMYLAAVGVELN